LQFSHFINEGVVQKNLIFKEYHKRLLTDSIGETFNICAPENVCKRIELKLRLIKQDIQLNLLAGCIVKDEGLFSYFYRQISKLLNSNQYAFEDLLNNHAVILLQGDPEVNYERIMKRFKETKVMTAGYDGLSKNEIIKRIDECVSLRMSLFRKIESNNGLALLIAPEQKNSINIKLIDDFIGHCMKEI